MDKLKKELDEDVHQGEKRPKLASHYLVLLFGWLLLLAYLTSLIDDRLPDPVSEEQAGTTRFSEARGLSHLLGIVGSGPRVAGSRYHYEKTVELYSLVDGMAQNATQTVAVDWQIVSGDYWLDYLRPFLNVYHNTSNIIAMVEGDSGLNADGTTNTSILFNCHYDTRPTSPGVSDNAMFCAAMAEVFHLLSVRPTRLRHNVIFLFNGAEENPLQGAPGFLSHPWAAGATAVVNLDSAGFNCKSNLFQVTDPRVLQAYGRAAPAPSAQSFGEYVFNSGIVPSNTDFRIFRDLASLYGVDIAFSKHGQAYHTRHDSLDNLHPGVVQHAGDLLLALAEELGDSEDFDEKLSEPSDYVYWDYLNLFMLSYSERTALLVDWLVVVVAAGSVVYYHWVVGFRQSMTLELLVSATTRLLSLVAGFAVMWALTAAMVATTTQLRYMVNIWVVVPYYWMPYLIGAVTASQLIDAWRWKKSGLNRVLRSCQAMAATRLLFTLALIILIPTTDGTYRYVVSMPLLGMSVASYVTLSAVKVWRLKAWQYIILEVALATPHIMFLYIVAIKINALLLPIMGRTIATKPDYVVAGLNQALVVVVAATLSGVELAFSRLRLWTVALVFTAVCLVVGFIPLSPYRTNVELPALQRHYWVNSDIVSYNQQGEQTARRTGVWFGKTEVHTPDNVRDLATAAGLDLTAWSTDFDCDNYTYCNLPMKTPRIVEHAANSLWVDFDAPSASRTAAELRLLSRSCYSNECLLTFSVIGPTPLSVSLWPRDNVTVTAWSFATALQATTTLNDRPVYFVYYTVNTYSEYDESFVFSVGFEVPDPTSTAPIVDVSFSANRIAHDSEATPAYQELMAAMPEYFNIESVLATRFNYVF